MDYEIFEEHLEIAKDALSFIGFIVDKYGKVLVPFCESSTEGLKEYHNDYFYFCLSKATRSLLAAIELSDKRFSQDIMAISRSAYESYLYLSNSINDLKFTSKAVKLRLYLHVGQLEYYKNPSGTINYNKLVNKKTKTEYDFDLRISTLSKNTFSSWDRLIHHEMYQYISEHVHTDFLGSGNYRTQDSKNYNVEPEEVQLQTNFMILYITFLLMDSLSYEIEFNREVMMETYTKDEIHEVNQIRSDISEALIEIIEEIDFMGYSPKFKINLVNRISHAIMK